MKVAIVKYNAGNIQSVTYALNRLGVEPIITDVPEELMAADKVIFPGVGEASSAMKYLKEKGLDIVLKNLKQPFLGVCLGMQLMCKHSEEGDTECLGIFDANVKRFPPQDKVPHMGWNAIKSLNGTLTESVPEDSYVYFVHSYCAEICEDTVAKCDYIIPFTAGLQKGNYYAYQFHPEKSGDIGAKILENFINL